MSEQEEDLIRFNELTIRTGFLFNTGLITIIIFHRYLRMHYVLAGKPAVPNILESFL